MSKNISASGFLPSNDTENQYEIERTGYRFLNNDGVNRARFLLKLLSCERTLTADIYDPQRNFQRFNLYQNSNRGDAQATENREIRYPHTEVCSDSVLQREVDRLIDRMGDGRPPLRLKCLEYQVRCSNLPEGLKALDADRVSPKQANLDRVIAERKTRLKHAAFASSVGDIATQTKICRNSKYHPRLTVFYQYEIPEYPGCFVKWEPATGLVHFTPLWRIIFSLDTIPDLSQLKELCPHHPEWVMSCSGHHTTQGIWIHYEDARFLAKQFCWKIRRELIIIFGETFPTECRSPLVPVDMAKVDKHPYISEEDRRILSFLSEESQDYWRLKCRVVDELDQNDTFKKSKPFTTLDDSILLSSPQGPSDLPQWSEVMENPYKRKRTRKSRSRSNSP
jgi:hypothetical protein